LRELALDGVMAGYDYDKPQVIMLFGWQHLYVLHTDGKIGDMYPTQGKNNEALEQH